MATPLHVLILEDQLADAELMVYELRRAGFSPTWQRVESEAAYLAGLDSPQDLILADFALPQFDALRALQLLRARDLDLPFIIVSGAIDEEQAVAAIQQGADDYLLKDRLARLGPAVRRALEQHHLRLEKQQAERVLRESEERFRAMVQNAADLITVIDPEGRIRYQSPSIERVLGYAPGDVLGRAMVELVAPNDRALLTTALDHMLHLSSTTLSFEARFRHENGSWRVLEVCGTTLPEQQGIRSVVLNSRDITERKQAEEQLRRSALYDSLTDLPNRAMLLERMTQAMQRAKRRPAYRFAVLFLDLDHFKVINDSLGHLAGDQLLIATARRLQTLVRPTDTVARLGGDEFVVLLDEVNGLGDVIHVVERLQQQLSLPFSLNGQEVRVTASVGVALGTSTYEQPEELLRDADTALYQAKGAGRERYALFNPEMHTEMLRRLQIEIELRRAIEQHELRLYYQPIVSLRSGTIQSVEALVRWQHPERGLLAPGEFITIAEETGLIIPLGEWVIQEACRSAQRWHLAGSDTLSVAVNLSSRQFKQQRVNLAIDRALKASGLAPRYLELELTESNAMEHADTNIAALQELKDLAVRVLIDDFGTGYSSLSYLSRFPIDAVKIDRSFIQKIASGPRDRAIVAAIVAMAHHLSLKVIAEGVETEEQFVFLRRCGCDAAQGYFFGRPMPADALTPLLRPGALLAAAR